jgi:hypothetical protein
MVPFGAKESRLGRQDIPGDDGDKQRALVDIGFDLALEVLPDPQSFWIAIKPDINPGLFEGVAN